MAIPKTFLPAGDSSFIWGVMIAREGSSPEQMHALQDRTDEAIRQNPAVEATFTMTGNGQFLASNQGLLLEFLKPPHERAPIQEVAGQLMGQIGAIPGVFPFLRPFPVLEISTGATNRNQGQYAFSVSGVNPDQVYEVSERLMGKLREYPGLSDHLLRLLPQHAQSGHRHPPRPGQDVRGLRDADFGSLAKRLLAKLPLSHQET